MAEKITSLYDVTQNVAKAKAQLKAAKDKGLSSVEIKQLTKAVKNAESALKAVKKALDESKKDKRA